MRLPTTRWEALRAAVWDRDRGECGVCGGFAPVTNFDADHIVAVADRGIDCMDNLRVTHPRCNRVLGGRTGSRRRWARVGPFRYTFTRPNCGDHCGTFQSITLSKPLLARLTRSAKQHRRTLTGEVIYILEQYQPQLFPDYLLDQARDHTP